MPFVLVKILQRNRANGMIDEEREEREGEREKGLAGRLEIPAGVDVGVLRSRAI